MLPKIVSFYHWSVGLLAVLLFAAIVVLIPSEAATLTSLVNINTPSFSFALVIVVIYSIGSVVCNYFASTIGTTGYLTLSMLFYLAAYLSLDPLVAVLAALIGPFWFEIFIIKRGLNFAARTVGMYVLCVMAAGYTYRALGGSVVTGDLTLNLIIPVIGSFLVFRLINDAIFQFTRTLQGKRFFMPIIQAAPRLYLTYLLYIPGALILSILATQVGGLALTMACGMVVGVNILMRLLSVSSLAERAQLSRSQELNSQMILQNDRQRELGNRINLTLDSFLTLVRDYAGTSHEQEAAVVQITATIEELSRTAAQIASSTDKVAAAADKAIDAADRGQNSVTNTVNASTEVQDKVREIAASILDLNQKSEHIGNIVTTINQIAGEIRLLALNATIEASGAGPYGRRFAVVANEVSDLADRSREASAAIRRIITEIQTATTSSVHATEEGLQQMQRSIAIALQSEKANNEIIEWWSVLLKLLPQLPWLLSNN
jgi:methyl-accepting chemotaxis protein